MSKTIKNNHCYELSSINLLSLICADLIGSGLPAPMIYARSKIFSRTVFFYAFFSANKFYSKITTYIKEKKITYKEKINLLKCLQLNYILNNLIKSLFKKIQ